MLDIEGNMEDEMTYIADFASRSFRDTADQDYIMARIAYRKEFDQQFRWCALQAIEKYLKAILLYNGCSAKGIGHNLVKALDKVKNIDNLGFELPSSNVEEFIKYISDYGVDRYFSHATHLKSDSLLQLDTTVWNIRRFCFYMNKCIRVDGQKYNLFEQYKKRITNQSYCNNSQKHPLFNGYLEKVIKNRLPSYNDLIWKNFFYGRIKKNKIKNYPVKSSSKNPTHSFVPGVFKILEERVDFPKEVKKIYQD